MLTPHGEYGLSGCTPIRWSCACRTARNWTIPLNRASPDWEPLSDMRQHGLDASDLAVTPDGVLGYWTLWLWTRDRATFGEENGAGPIEG